MLVQLIYTSKRHNCSEIEIQKILESARINNANNSITGVLLYNETDFLQLIEGEYEDITNLYSKIKPDYRHTNCLLINFSAIDERSFAGWNMGVNRIPNKFEFLTEFNSKDIENLKNTILGIPSKTNSSSTSIIKKLFLVDNSNKIEIKPK